MISLVLFRSPLLPIFKFDILKYLLTRRVYRRTRFCWRYVVKRKHIGTSEILTFHCEVQTVGQVPRETGESPNLEIFKTQLIKVMNNLFKPNSVWVGDQTKWPLDVLSSLKFSMILSFCATFININYIMCCRHLSSFELVMLMYLYKAVVCL